MNRDPCDTESVVLLEESRDDRNEMQRRVKVRIMNSFFTEDEILQTFAQYYDRKFGFSVRNMVHLFKEDDEPSDEYVQISWKNIDLK